MTLYQTLSDMGACCRCGAPERKLCVPYSVESLPARSRAASHVPERVSKTSPPGVVVMVLACSDLSKEWAGRRVLACSNKPLNDGHWIQAAFFWRSCLTVGWLVGSATLVFSCIHRSAATDCVVASHEEVSCARWRRNRATWGALAGNVGSLSSVAQRCHRLNAAIKALTVDGALLSMITR